MRRDAHPAHTGTAGVRRSGRVDHRRAAARPPAVQTVCVDERYQRRGSTPSSTSSSGEGRRVSSSVEGGGQTTFKSISVRRRARADASGRFRRTFAWPQLTAHEGQRQGRLHGRLRRRGRRTFSSRRRSLRSAWMCRSSAHDASKTPSAGLSQLQLRRRRPSGRGRFWSYCDTRVGRAHGRKRARWKVNCATRPTAFSRGGRPARRGPGDDFFGNRQHGLPALHHSSAQTTAVNDARDAARTVPRRRPDALRARAARCAQRARGLRRQRRAF